MTRPRLLIGVAGTATDVGKTFVGAALAVELRARGLSIAARKPAQSFEPPRAAGPPAERDDRSVAHDQARRTERSFRRSQDWSVRLGVPPTDADVLAAATGEAPADVCPPHRWYEVPMAPPMAADVLGRPVPTLAELVGEIAWPDDPVDVGLVETVGGVRSPVAVDGDSRDLLRAVAPDVVLLVADAGLGTIDAVRLAVDALAPLPTVVFLNRSDAGDDLHRRNRDWLTVRDALQCAVDVPTLADRLTRSA